MSCKTQGEMLADQLKRRPHTYGDMLGHKISTSPQKRVAEWLEQQAKAAAPNPCPWRLVKTKARVCGAELVRWQIKRNRAAA
jgi:hypothetical protein